MLANDDHNPITWISEATLLAYRLAFRDARGHHATRAIAFQVADHILMCTPTAAAEFLLGLGAELPDNERQAIVNALADRTGSDEDVVAPPGFEPGTLGF